MTEAHSPAAPETVDGRRAGRERNRNAVVDALLDLYQEGVISPGAQGPRGAARYSVARSVRAFAATSAACRALRSRNVTFSSRPVNANGGS